MYEPQAWRDYLVRASAKHGNELDLSSVDQRFVPYFQGGRIKVRFYGEGVKTGTVSVTTGWRPSLMLMLRSDSRGSSWLLDKGAELLAIQRNGKYITREEAGRKHD